MATLENSSDVVITIGADDQTKSAFTSATQGLESIDKNTRRLNNEIERTGSVSAIAAQGLRHMNSIVSGMVFGVVASVVSVATDSLVNYFKEMVNTKDQMEALTKNIIDQATAWKILPESMEKVTESTVKLYNAQLKYRQIMGEDKGVELQRQIDNLKKLRDEAEKNVGIMTDFGEIQGDNRLLVAKYNVEIEKSVVALQKWKEIQEMLPTIINEVNKAMGKFNPAETNAYYELQTRTMLDEIWTKARTEKQKKDDEAAQVYEEHRLKIEQDLSNKLLNEQYDYQSKSAQATDKALLETQRKMNEYAIVAIPMALEDEEIASLKEKIALNDEYNSVMNEGNSSIDVRMKKMVQLGQLTQKEMEQVQQNIAVHEMELALKKALTSAIESYILGTDSLEDALKKALAAELAHIAASAAVNAILYTAFGFAALAGYMEQSAAYYFVAAGMFASIAAATGQAAMALNKSAGGADTADTTATDYSTSSDASSSSSSADTTTTSSSGSSTVYTVYYINAIDTQTFSEYVKKNSSAITGVVASDIKNRGAVNSAIISNT